MNRRQVLLGMAAAALSLKDGHAAYQCYPNGACTYGVPSNRFQFAFAFQQMDQWCWAACVQMVFNYYGHRVPQHEIVNRIWGRVVNLPAVGPQIYNALSGRWVDERGMIFYSQAEVLLDMQYNINRQDRGVIVLNDLMSEHPLVIGTMGHAMVLTATTMQNGPYGSVPVQSIVRDPWPHNAPTYNAAQLGALPQRFISDETIGRRELSYNEVVAANFMVRVRVS